MLLAGSIEGSLFIGTGNGATIGGQGPPISINNKDTHANISTG